MRLTHQQIDTIKNVLSKSLNEFSLFLFGSRLHDHQKGGDIDLLVQTSQEVSLKDQLKILAKLEYEGISRKIDLIFDTPKQPKTEFFQSIQKQKL